VAISNPVDIGKTDAAVGTSTTVAFTTTGAVASGGKLFVHVGWFGASITLSSGSGGSLTWTVDSQVANGSDHEGLMWADAPAGLASSSTITATFSGGADGRHIAGDYVTGAATGAAAARTSGTTGTTAWTSGSLTVSAGSILMGSCYNETGTNPTNTPSGGNTEIHDSFTSGDSAHTSCYQIGTGASIAASGTWTGSGTLAAVGVRFDPASATSAPAFQPRRMPLGV
jgi:hypothetical protein